MESNTPEHPIKTNGNEFQKQASLLTDCRFAWDTSSLWNHAFRINNCLLHYFSSRIKIGVFGAKLDNNCKSSTSKIRESGCDRRVSFSSIRQGLGQARTRSPTSASFFVWQSRAAHHRSPPQWLPTCAGLYRGPHSEEGISSMMSLNLYPPWSELIRYNFMEKGQSFYIDSPDSLSLNILILISTKWTNHQRLYKKKQLPFLGQLKLEIYLSSTSSNRLLLFSVLRKLEKHHLAIFLPTLLLRLKYWTAK